MRLLILSSMPVFELIMILNKMYDDRLMSICMSNFPYLLYMEGFGQQEIDAVDCDQPLTQQDLVCSEELEALKEPRVAGKKPRSCYELWGYEGSFEEPEHEEELIADIVAVQQPDIASYLQNFSLSDEKKIKMCRAYASYLVSTGVAREADKTPRKKFLPSFDEAQKKNVKKRLRRSPAVYGYEAPSWDGEGDLHRLRSKFD